MIQNLEEERPVKVELKKMEQRWERDAERIAKEIYNATRKGELAK